MTQGSVTWDQVVSSADPENRACHRCSNVDCPLNLLVQQKIKEQGLVITHTNINVILYTDIVYNIVYNIVYYMNNA